MLPIRSLEKIVLIIVLWGLCSLLYLEGRPLSKRSISEVQLMHNVREHKEMLERQDWLQLKLNNILIPSINDSQKEQKGKASGPSIRRLRKGEGAAWIVN
ncbi:parathyroid hormone-like [Puntigrus tetrazona]|uniref:parathyroid hormone 1b n=1 Tax=Puntigrus tetrazona TaxID=1606681 RepID=UPI001C891CBA|nr:parathyroid hormone 1b [Puntigrus tetrazona]XP_043100723.1 parathyroid hormone-like [Puntigrus tetrazona]